jgi:glucose/arabinose dehydrogenase
VPGMLRSLLPAVLIGCTCAATAGAAAVTPAGPAIDSLRSTAGTVSVDRVPIARAVVRDSSGRTRGPATAALRDGRVLLGGGSDGRRLLIADPRTGKVRTIGTLYRASARRDDARFAPTDIEVMATSRTRVRLFVAFPQYRKSRGCVRLAVNRIDITRGTKPRITRRSPVFRSKPCVPPAAIQHAAGRLVRISKRRAYVTLGDLGQSRISDRRARGQLGSVLRIAKGRRAVRISQGHRNGQGLTLDSRGRLWGTEHGPRGGDELNLIRRGRDYGWPFVTLGQPYGPTDYVIPARTGTHAGYTRPRTAWVPSVATSEIVQVPRSWRGWRTSAGGDLLIGTLKDKSFWRIRVTAKGRVTDRERLPVGHRIRDLDVRRDGTLVASTDDGTLLVLTGPR